MKCIRDGVSGEIRRVSDDKAEQMVRDYPALWHYCPKRLWKAQKEAK